MNILIRTHFLIMLVVFVLSGEAGAKAKTTSCQEIRAGVDMGSGSTKILVAKVDYCEKKIKEVYWENQVKISFQEDLLENQKKGLGPLLGQKIQEEGLSVLKEFKEKVRREHASTPLRWMLVATAWVRLSQNGKKFLRRIERELKIPSKIITQEEEARLGYFSALSQWTGPDQGKKKELEKIVVWDIGGGSMQVTSFQDGKGWSVYQGQLASVGFKNMVMEVFQGKDLQKEDSPNPIGGPTGEMVLKLAGAYARLHLPPTFKDMDRNHRVLGIGGVHYHSIGGQTQTKGKIYTQSDLEKALEKRVLMNDKELENDFASTEVTNLLLVLGFMKEMKVGEVHNLKTQVLNGLLVSPHYW